ncbi:MAG TPA: FAD-dependent oxidoreductase [Puia sp.]|nr:FAD-dependent oxidoreductase [Puia sp.]
MKVETLIVGGGLAGLSCARELHRASRPYLLVEREKETGGLCRTVLDRGFTFDYTGHFLHFQKKEMKKWVLELVGKELKTRVRHAAIYSQGTYSEYPYQENNAGLPSDVARENVLGYLEAALHRRFSGVVPSHAADFRTWCLQAFGPGLSKHFMFPYNEKLWKLPLSRLPTHWMGRFVPSPRVLEVLKGAFHRQSSASGYNATFLYPDKGGISILPRAIARDLPNLWRGVGLKNLDLRRRRAVLTSGIEIQFDRLVSSLPLPRLVALSSGMPASLVRDAKNLRATSIYNINLGIKGRQPIPYSWVYFPEKEFGFHRAGSVSACVPTVAPKGHSSVYVEFSYRGARPDGRALGRHAAQKLKRLGWIKNESRIVSRVDLDLPGAYVIYDSKRDETVGALLAFLRRNEVQSIGRYGRWEYGSMESAMEQGIQAAREILGKR